jgi:hypothetical protein
MPKKYLVNLFLTTSTVLTFYLPIVEVKLPWLGKNTASAQVTSTAFRNAAFAATSEYNNVNLACAGYARALYNFVKPNARKYKIKSYKIYKLEAPRQILHLDYENGDVSISQNGVHYYLIIDGYAFDNHHPTGKLTLPFFAGFIVSETPKITEITIANIRSVQC